MTGCTEGKASSSDNGKLSEQGMEVSKKWHRNSLFQRLGEGRS